MEVVPRSFSQEPMRVVHVARAMRQVAGGRSHDAGCRTDHRANRCADLGAARRTRPCVSEFVRAERGNRDFLGSGGATPLTRNAIENAAGHSRPRTFRGTSPKTETVNAIVFHAEAKADLISAIAHYDGLGDGLGDELRDEVERAAQRISDRPSSFSRSADQGHMKCVLKRFPYTLHFVEFDGLIEIMAVAHHRRDPDYWKQREPG